MSVFLVCRLWQADSDTLESCHSEIFVAHTNKHVCVSTVTVSVALNESCVEPMNKHNTHIDCEWVLPDALSLREETTEI